MNMEDYVRSSREADLAFLEATNTIAIAMDTESIDLFTEGADDKKSGFVDTIISKIRDLAEKIKKFFDDLFTSAKTKLLKSTKVFQTMPCVCLRVRIRFVKTLTILMKKI